MKKALITVAFRQLAIAEIARVAWAAAQTYAHAVGEDQRELNLNDESDQAAQAAFSSTEKYLDDESLTAEALHNQWLSGMLEDGWAYGEAPDTENMIHPFILPFAERSREYQTTENIFCATVRAASRINISELVPEVKVVPVAVQAEAVQQQAAPVLAKNYIPVKYIGRKKDWQDKSYGTNLYFVTEQVRNLPVSIAKKLLRHADLFTEVLPKEESELVSAIHDVVDEIATAGSSDSIAADTREESDQSDQDDNGSEGDKDNEAEDAESQENEGFKDDTEQLLDDAKKDQEEKDLVQNRIQETYDMIDRMASKEEVSEFANAIPYQTKIPKTLKLDNMKEQAKRLVDQYGVL